ncbi:MAG: uroporphyrinogen-III synthase [Actinomycetota bacterium]
MTGEGPSERDVAPDTRGRLAGRTVVVTRPASQSGALVAALAERGARALVAPAVRLVPAPTDAIDRAIRDVADGRYDWMILTSRAGVQALYDGLDRTGTHPDGLRARIAVVGAGTARALADRGVRPHLIPPTFTTESLAEAMPPGPGRVLLARADIASPELEARLESKGWSADRITAYRTELEDELPDDVERALRGEAVDAVTFTSASTVRGFLRMAARLPPEALAGPGRPAVVCIGPITASEVRAAGLVVDAVARPHTIDGLMEALERVVGRPSH